MKLPTLSPVTRQLIILGLIVVLLWYGSGPIIGSDGRIMCCSADYRAINFLNYLKQSDQFPETVDMVQMVHGNAPLLELINLPVGRKYWYEPSSFWQTAIDYIPVLTQIPRIRSKAQGGWIFYFSVTPEQWEAIRKVGNGLVYFQ